MELFLNYYNLSLFLGGVVALLSGAAVYFTDHRKPENIAWMFLNMSTAVWSFAYFSMITRSDAHSALVSNWILHGGAILIPVFYLAFIVTLTRSAQKHGRIFFILIPAAAFFLWINTSPDFVTGVLPKEPFAFAPNAGPLYGYFTFFFFATVLYALAILAERIRQTKEQEATRLKYVLFSSVFGFVGGGFVFFLTFNIPIPPYPIVLFTFYPLIIAYTMLRHKLFNVKVAATEILTGSIWIFLLFRTLLSENPTEQAKERCRILAFWEKHGDGAAQEAFRVSRRTLFRWQKKLRDTQGKLEGLNRESTAPQKRRKRQIPDAVRDFILKEREYDPRLSKDKLAVLLKEDGVASLSASTVGRMLTDLKKQGILKHTVSCSLSGRTGRLLERKPRAHREKVRSLGHTGGLVKADTIVRFTNGIKRYVITAIDKETKFAFAYACKSHASDAARDFMRTFKTVAPLSLTHVQTDNGSEFEKHFHLYLTKTGIVHFNTCPRCPKMNSDIERFNRTLSDAFIKQHRMLLAYDSDAFNRALIDWLLWYNTRRPHWSLGLVSPLRYIVSTLAEPECHMLWTDTDL